MHLASFRMTIFSLSKLLFYGTKGGKNLVYSLTLRIIKR
jgi:hypothetical protein